ncbi:hypothetical protein [Roseisolibacter sp. H3M3-2]|uniref:hypothetical protein n=1 Tax=Roseisolibacter sp. H3M3-2 TaxID=3031323 RepID=UPI0023DA5899|nr:hypothetical protein [Roseisolibacter sp. H3M3-2]MDF1503983.1 hypothetical protein [Roseisolibacter sp. H3M3-2]
MNDKQLAKLIKQNQAKAAAKATKPRGGKAFDPTLVTKKEDDDADIERQQLFKELKRREF